MSRSEGSPRLAQELASMKIGETRHIKWASRNRLESSVRIHCRRVVMDEIKSFRVFQKDGSLFVTRGENL